MSVIPRPTGLGGGPMARVRMTSPATAPAIGDVPSVADVEVRFGVSVGGLSRSELAGELERRTTPPAKAVTMPVAIRLAIHHVDAPGDPSRCRSVRARVRIDLDGTPLGENAASFTIVGSLRGTLTLGDRHHHLDLADDAGPWLRCSVARSGASGRNRGGPSNRTDSAYLWARPISDWRIAGGTSSPCEVSASLGAVEDLSPTSNADDPRHAAAGS